MPRVDSSTSVGPSRAGAPPMRTRDVGGGVRVTPAAAPAAAPIASPTASPAPVPTAAAAETEEASVDGLSGFAEELANRILKPLDLVLLSRERIQATLDDAAERGRVTRGDANELVAELFRRGRQQTDDLLEDVEGLVGRGREQLESATKLARRSPPVDRLVRGADLARRSVGVGSPFPISGYDELTVGQISQRLPGLSAPQLRQLRDYERRHANRKSVLAAVEKLLADS
jgi:polyhydroxyalkanoate synthesis regulator phasin